MTRARRRRARTIRIVAAAARFASIRQASRSFVTIQPLDQGAKPADLVGAEVLPLREMGDEGFDPTVEKAVDQALVLSVDVVAARDDGAKKEPAAVFGRGDRFL